MSHGESHDAGALPALIAHIQANIFGAEDEAAAVRENVNKEIASLSENLKTAKEQPLIKGVIYDIETGAVIPASEPESRH
jgi:carbonic anhydrase